MTDSRDELDPARLAAMRSLLMGHARSDAARGRSAATRRRIVGVSVSVGLVAAIAAGAVTIAFTGLPIFGGPPAATDVPLPTFTPTPTPTPTPTVPPAPPAPTTTAPPAPVASTVVIGADDLFIEDDSGNVLGQYPYTGDLDSAVSALTNVMGAPQSAHTDGAKCVAEHTSLTWDGLELEYSQRDFGAVSFKLFANDPSTTTVVESPNGARVGESLDEYAPSVAGNAQDSGDYSGTSVVRIVDTPAANPTSPPKSGLVREGVVVAAENGVIVNIAAPWSLDADC